jgi:Lrp/AsnC family leucine-responsive transcriptional regulator
MDNMATETVALDKIDKQILSILQTDGRISWQLLGDRVHLSANAVAERVRRMTRAGVIRGFKAEVNQAALGRTLEAVIDARMPHTQGFDDAVMKRDDVLWAAHVTGESDITLAVACDGTAGLDSLLRWLQREGAAETRTDVVLRKIR